MINVERIEEWRGETVIDASGEQLGKLDEVYFDAKRGDALLVAVRSGVFGRRARLAPIAGASVGRAYLRLAHSKQQFDASAETGSEGGLDEGALDAVESSYGVKLPEELELWSASEMEAHRAEAEEIRRRADELERQAQAKLAARDAAREQAQGAATSAEAAERDAEQAREAAVAAREQANRFERG